MTLRALSLSVLLTLFASAVYAETHPWPESVGVSSERLERIDAAIQSWVDDDHIGGAVAYISRGGETVYHKAFGWQDVASETPMETDTLMRIFSMTKPIACAAMMILVEDGKATWSDPVTDYLPEFETAKVVIHPDDPDKVTLVPPKSPITLKHLANHTSGVGYGPPVPLKSEALTKKYEDADLFNPDQTLEEMVKKIADLPLVHHPGEKWTYGAGIDVLARVVEVISGQPFGDFLDEHIFTPLGMDDTGFTVPEQDWDRVATTYTYNEDGELVPADETPLLQEPDYKNRKHQAGGHGLISTARDYALFAESMLNNSPNAGDMISPAAVSLMAADTLDGVENNTPWFDDQTNGFGLGVSVVKDRGANSTIQSLGTFSWSGYASTLFFVDPELDLVAVYMSQHVPTNPQGYWTNFTNLVYQALLPVD